MNRMNKKINMEKRIERLEKEAGYVSGRVPGTSLTRVITETSIEWTLTLGLFQDRKKFFTAPTIEECLKSAEKELLSKSKNTKE